MERDLAHRARVYCVVSPSDPCVDDSGPGGARLHTGVQWRTELEVAVSRLCCSGICLFVLVEARGVGSRGYYTVDLDVLWCRSRSRASPSRV